MASAESEARRLRAARWRLADIGVALLAILLALAYFFELLVGDRGIDFTYIRGNIGRYIGSALQVNLLATSIAFGAGLIIGFLVGWLRTIRMVSLRKALHDYRVLARGESQSKVEYGTGYVLTVLWVGTKYTAHRVGDAFVELIRGTPLVLQLFLLWTVLLVSFPEQGNVTDLAFIAGVVALTVNTGGYQAEIFRAGLQTVHSGQVEAARALGLSRLGAMRHVVLPQAVRLIIPPLTNEFIGLFKASSILYFVGLRGEITFLANSEAFRGHVFEIFAMVSAIFLGITVTLSKISQLLEQRMRIPGLGIQFTSSGPIPRPPIRGGTPGS